MKAEHRHDPAVERLLRRSPGADAAARTSGACLDAETMAAWMDGGLDEGALAMAEAHVSGCARCQALVGALSRSAPVVQGAASWWRRDWSIRWLVPLTAGAAAIVLWMVVPAERPARVGGGPEGPPPQEQVQAPSGGAAEEKRDAPASPRPAELRTEAARQPAAKADRPDEREAAGRETTEGLTRTNQAAALDSAGRIAAERAAPPPPPAAASAPAAPRAARSRADTPAESPVPLGQSTLSSVIVSPDPAIRWRLGPGGSVERSTDTGSTWESLSTGVSAELTAGSSPSPAVCWIVGRAGVVLLTTDGRRWERLSFPEAVDLVAVHASDPQTANVSTADGRTFRTADGGRTWIQGFRIQVLPAFAWVARAGEGALGRARRSVLRKSPRGGGGRPGPARGPARSQS